MTGGEAIIATEVGQHEMWAAQFFKYDNAADLPDHLRRPGNHGLRPWAQPIGAKLGMSGQGGASMWPATAVSV